MKKEQLLAEVEDILRTMPSLNDFERADNDDDEATADAWVGRAVATIQRWNPRYIPDSNNAAQNLRTTYFKYNGFRTLRTVLHQAHADLQMELGQTSVVVGTGQVFQYFEELRKVIEAARVEVFFVDRYLDAEFVSRYLPLVVNGVSIRLLSRDRMSTLTPAVDLFQQESKRAIQLRASEEIHDRYLFIDQTDCYFSGASFKDGAKNSPALIAKVGDAFRATWDIYERYWNEGKVYR